jgi:hypothetical protein
MLDERAKQSKGTNTTADRATCPNRLFILKMESLPGILGTATQSGEAENWRTSFNELKIPAGIPVIGPEA